MLKRTPGLVSRALFLWDDLPLPFLNLVWRVSGVMRFRMFDWGLTLGCAALLGYFAWHANEGPRGYKFRDKLLADASRLEGELVTLEKERSSFEDHVALLRPNSVDPDLLDQLARERLEMAKPDELIVRLPRQ